MLTTSNSCSTHSMNGEYNYLVQNYVKTTKFPFTLVFCKVNHSSPACVLDEVNSIFSVSAL